MNEKAKVNLPKVVEAELERDHLKQTYHTTIQESSKILSSVNTKLDFEILARMVVLLESSFSFYQNVAQKLQNMLPEVENYRNYVESVSFSGYYYFNSPNRKWQIMKNKQVIL